MKYKPDWEAWSFSKVTLRNGNSWTSDLKEPAEGLILAGGECGPIDTTLYNISWPRQFYQSEITEKAEKIKGYRMALLSVVDQGAKAYHVERLAVRVLK